MIVFVGKSKSNSTGHLKFRPQMVYKTCFDIGGGGNRYIRKDGVRLEDYTVSQTCQTAI
jgi:hypothetical protein